MAQTAIAGTTGTLTFTGHICRTTKWTITATQDANDCTGFGATGNWRLNLPGLKGWKFSASGYLLAHGASSALKGDYSATNDAPATDSGGITVTLGLDTACTYTGTAFPTEFVMGTDINGNAIASFGGIGQGTLTEAISTT